MSKTLGLYMYVHTCRWDCKYIHVHKYIHTYSNQMIYITEQARARADCIADWFTSLIN